MLLSVIAVTLICALAGAGTMAWFTSRAVSEENTFVAGTLILGGKPGQVEGENPVVDEEGFVREKFASISSENMEPGETRNLDPVDLKNMGTLPLRIVRIWADEAVNEPPNMELASVLDATVKFDGVEAWTGSLASLFTPQGGYFELDKQLPAGEKTLMTVDIHMDELANNDFQGVSLKCDLHLLAVQTNRTTVIVMDSFGNPLEGAEITYYSSGWKTLGTTDASGRIDAPMDPDRHSTAIRIKYKGYTKTFNGEDIHDRSVFIFGTAPVTVRLINSEGQPIAGAEAQVHFAPDYPGGTDGSYRTLGYTDANGEVKAELLPYEYWFKITYRSVTTNGVSYNIVADPLVEFQTGKVHSVSGKCNYLHKSGGGTTIAFKQDMELLPTEYVFRFSDGNPNETKAVIAGQTTNIH